MTTKSDMTVGLPAAEPITRSITERVASKYGMEARALSQTLAKTIFPSEKDATPEQVAALLIVADQHDLNPFTNEIYAFPKRGGGIVPVIGVDGWYRAISQDPTVRGIRCDFEHDAEDRLVSATASINKAGWDEPVVVTEYLKENKRNTPPWTQQPHRMLRHRAITQCARVACGLTGVYTEDEAKAFAEPAAAPAAATGAPVTLDLGAARAVARPAPGASAPGLARAQPPAAPLAPEPASVEADQGPPAGEPSFEEAAEALFGGGE